MKKLALVLGMVAVMATSAISAFALPSTGVNTIVDIDNSQDKNGNDVNMRVDNIRDDQKDMIDDLLGDDENLKDLLGNDYDNNYQVIDRVNAYPWDKSTGSYWNNPELFPIKNTFKVPGVTSKSDVKIIQYVDGVWKVIKDVVPGDGTVVVELDTMSPDTPLIFLVAQGNNAGGGAGAGAGGTGTSPKTGETDVPMAVAMVGAIALAGVVVFRKKVTA